MTEYENEPFIVGDYNHNQVEFMHLSHEKWYTASPVLDQLVKVKRIFGYAVVSRPRKVFLLGGNIYTDEEHFMKQILLYQNHIWEPLGELKHARMNFMTITYGTDVMILGGKTYEKDEGDFGAEIFIQPETRNGAIELFSLIDETESMLGSESDQNLVLTDLTNMVLPNAMFSNGISIILDDVSTCQETQIGMNIKI